MTTQAPFLVVAIPLFTALIMGVFGLIYPSIVRWVGGIGISFAAISSVVLFNTVSSNGIQEYFFGNWPAPIGIAYSVDHLNALMILLIYVVAFFAFIYSLKSVPFEIKKNKHAFYYTLYFLLISGLVGITITGDAFNLYVLFEICALSSYALLASGGKKTYLATFYYLLIGSIGACFYLIGVAYLFIKTGSLNMAHIFELIPPIYFTKSILIGFIFINLGLFIKMALFPVHGWLPNIYTKAPISTTCLLAPLGTKLTIYILIRFYFDVFTPEFVFHVLNIKNVMVWLSTIAIIVGSMYAIFHTNYRKIIAFIVVAEIGYIVGGIWTGHPDSLTGAIYHILADSLMTLSLFMIGGMILFYIKSEKLSDCANIFKQLPFTAVALIIVFASIVGIPPTSGFFSKMYLIKGAFQMGYYQFIVALLFSSLASLFIFFRLFESYFYNKSDDVAIVRIKESRLFVIPLLSISTGIIVLGVTFNYWFHYIQHIIPVGLR
jgi:multicomponent Na+:H+ antiporter subunit D